MATRVQIAYEELVQEGYTKKQAAKIAQKKTGLALVTGKPPKRGQYNYGKQSRSGQVSIV